MNMDDIFKSVFHEENVSVLAVESDTDSPQSDSTFSSTGADKYASIRSTLEMSVKTIDGMNTECLEGTELAQCLAILYANASIEVWNNKRIVFRCVSLLEKILAQMSISSSQLSQYFSQHREICDKLNNHIRKAVNRENWTDKAITCAVYRWYCHSLNYPLVSDYLDVLIPPALLFVDSYVDSIKLKGVQCLYHVMNECGRTELRWHGRAQVIYDALQKLTYSRDAALLTALHPAVIKILRVVEMETEEFAEAIYCRLLGDMYLEDKLALRRAYISSLDLYIRYLGRRVIKHLKLTMKVVLSYLEHSSLHETRIYALRILGALINCCQPRIQFYSADMTKHLLRLLVDILMKSVDTTTTRDDEVEEIAHVLKEIPDRTLVIDSITGLTSAFIYNAQLRESFEQFCSRLS